MDKTEFSKNTLVKSVLVYSSGEAIGDGLNKLPFIRALRRTFPTAWITWFAGDGNTVYTDKLAPAIKGWIDEVIDTPLGAQRWQNVLKPRMRDRYFDVIIDTQRKLKATVEQKLYPHGVFVSGTLNGLLSERRAPGQPWLHSKPESFLDQLFQLAELARDGHVSGTLDPNGVVEVDWKVAEHAAALIHDSNAVLLAPGASRESKRWPLDHFLGVSKTLSRQGFVPVFVIGPQDTAVIDLIRNALPEAQLPLQAADAEAMKLEPFLTMALAQRCRLAIANDSGIGHILAASGVSLITLFGPTNARKFAPYTRRLKVIDARDFGGREMADIPVEAVETAAMEMLRAEPAAEPA